ncbi:MAG: InlB B-repeat-containing protein, partial [Lentisphaerales bacterium]|nr:InlB B-repeat-containing protein [Lentisphaerales bacterium]
MKKLLYIITFLFSVFNLSAQTQDYQTYKFNEVDHSVEVATDQSNRLIGSQTWTCWFKLSSDATGYNTLINAGGSAINNYRAGFLYINSDNLGGYVYRSIGNTSTSNVLHDTKIIRDTWYFAVYRLDAEANTLEVFLNNSPSGAVSTTYENGGSTTSPWTFGNRATHAFSGDLSNILIFNRALTNQEITDLYNSGFPKKFIDYNSSITDSAVIALELTENANALIDQSGNSNNAVANNGVTADGSLLTYEIITEISVLSFIAGPNGTISGNTIQTIINGQDATPITAAPNTGYEFINWSNGSIANPLKLTNVNSDASITANFDLIDYLVMFMTLENGSILGEEIQLVPYQTDALAVSAIPEPGYVFTQWDDGNTDNPRTMANVTEDKLLIAEFAPVQYTVDFNTDGNGTISGTASQNVDYSQSTTEVTAVANSGFIFKQWSDGSTQNPRIIQSVTSNLNLTAEFIAPPSSGNSYSEDFSSADSLNSWSVQS